MPGLIIVGMQWGDEGKGKIVDFLTQDADVVVRYQGGNNAGHTVVVAGHETVLHLIPSGILHDNKLCVIGNGTVVDPAVLVDELDGLVQAGVEVDSRLKISESAHLIMPHHKSLDGIQESFRGQKKIGTTGRGIGPAYADKADRFGIRVGDLLDPELFREKVESVVAYKNKIIAGSFDRDPLDPAAIVDEYLGYRDRIADYVCDTVSLVHDALRRNERVVFEGAQGAMLDVDHGTFPYVTSSSTMAGGALPGAGVGFRDIQDVLGIVKAYSTRVGSGPMPTELTDDTGHRLRKNGNEFGATTGRARRCGWLDAVQLRRAVMVNGITGMIITKPDVLSGFQSLRMCTGYEIEGTITTVFPTRLTQLEKAIPIYEEFPGWDEDIGACRSWTEFPERAQTYFRRMEEVAGAPIHIVSVGPGREETVVCSETFGAAGGTA